MPEWLRPASCCDDWIPGQHPQAWRSRRAAVFRDAWRRRRSGRGELRPADGEDSCAARPRSGERLLRLYRTSTRPVRPLRHSSSVSTGTSARRGRGPRADGRRGCVAGRLHRSRRGSRIQPGGHGRRMQRVGARPSSLRFQRSKGATNLPHSGQEIVVPASIANLGPGFDTLGLAVSAVSSGSHCRCHRRWARPAGLSILRRPDRRAQPDRSRLSRVFVAAASASVARCRGAERRFRFAADSAAAPRQRLPAFGLASWSKAGGRRTKSCAAASKIEGHPDNAAPALFGGLTSCCVAEDRSIAVTQWPWPARWRIVVATPDVELGDLCFATGAADGDCRCADAVFNLQHSRCCWARCEREAPRIFARRFGSHASAVSPAAGAGFAPAARVCGILM